ncbi:CaiB/BaiF CoA transferase family protein [Hydrogenophaga sp. BPS33]|uniref:CaiB/BaiF CoA transferase family protein n=1 Tax=Hydrogenophaga sp. BPS33 TaxID=2651974 RepID=UPI0013593D97|nr:CoA transferase [Hydrogenophaga sp. BPS33]
MPTTPVTTPPAALDGLKVVDLSRLIAGPYSAMLLADLGADVIKVEQPGKGDDSRFLNPSRGGMSSVFVSMNRNKRSIALDLKSPEGREVVLDLIRRADVVVENFAAGTMERVGLGYDTLAALNPRLVYCAITGFGRDGHYASRPGFDPVIQADSGMFSLNGYPDRPPVRSASPVVDVGAGAFAFSAILAALLARQHTGVGQYVESALFDTAIALTANYSMNYLLTGNEPTRQGNGSVISHPVGLYAARDGDFYITCSSDRMFRNLCEVLEEPELAQRPEFKTNAERCRHEHMLNEHLSARFRQSNRQHWVERLLAVSVPAGLVRSVGEAMRSEEVKDRGLVTTVRHPVAGELPNIAPPIRLKGTPIVPARAAPLLGEHTDQILREDLGYDSARIAHIQARGACGEPAPALAE